MSLFEALGSCGHVDQAHVMPAQGGAGTMQGALECVLGVWVRVTSAGMRASQGGSWRGGLE